MQFKEKVPGAPETGQKVSILLVLFDLLDNLKNLSKIQSLVTCSPFLATGPKDNCLQIFGQPAINIALINGTHVCPTRLCWSPRRGPQFSSALKQGQKFKRQWALIKKKWLHGFFIGLFLSFVICTVLSQTFSDTPENGLPFYSDLYRCNHLSNIIANFGNTSNIMLSKRVVGAVR